MFRKFNCIGKTFRFAIPEKKVFPWKKSNMCSCTPLIPPNPPLKKRGKEERFPLEKSLSDQTYQTFPHFLKGD
ncbi:MAG: hypothetical protein DWB56_03670 [Candidatus Jettenia sp.]|uniref:Uncharacterized protein n=1 Tax=Candidatus Jettenia caeni TaxID=247490 RepID=I3IN83_9BACT|nr:MAG: hypothetical protein EDM77_02345 [Candidatus Jettenia sp. AMX1]MBC6928059.1 hypothetical protein [Candidatus Jettenia sp.]MCE7879300.1 hypothetical protein [Candidatus Jettenia sp. AMX1]MCQ3927475.1 hypothetical protein [Candidatus Jettenia sp.]GAB63178.1 hypothetical protein KSU1_C1582 [Candidatus Jettenia caeni]